MRIVLSGYARARLTGVNAVNRPTVVDEDNVRSKYRADGSE